MRAFRLHAFGLENLRLDEVAPPEPKPDEVILELKALSLNYRDLLVAKGLYNPKLKLPAIPISDGAGVVSAVGSNIRNLRIGDSVVSHFVTGWVDGPFKAEYIGTSLGTPGPGLAVERVALPATAVLPMPSGYTYAQAATLPIAALTAWSALVTEGRIQSNQTVLTLGTGGVSLFVLQLAKSFGAKVIITSGHVDKLERARSMGADFAINYRTQVEWDKDVQEWTGGLGADITVETGGAGTLERSLKATRAGGLVAFLGALTGLKSELNVAPILMKRLHVAGIYVDSRTNFTLMIRHLEDTRIKPVIDRTFAFDDLVASLRYLESGAHFGKIVIEL